MENEKEFVEQSLFDIICKQFPQLDIEDVTELIGIMSNYFEFKEQNIPMMEKFVNEDISLEDRKSLINYNIEMYRDSCEKNYDNGDEAIEHYIKQLQATYGVRIWKTQGYFSDPEKFDSGEYKDIYVWCK